MIIEKLVNIITDLLDPAGKVVPMPIPTEKYKYQIKAPRRTGRTYRNLLRAILKTLEGNNVVIIAATNMQTRYLQDNVCRILTSMNINVVKTTSNLIEIYIDKGLRTIKFDARASLNKDFMRGRSDCQTIFFDHYKLGTYNARNT